MGTREAHTRRSNHRLFAEARKQHSRTNLRWRKWSFTIEARFAFYREVAPGTFARGCGAGATAHSRERETIQQDKPAVTQTELYDRGKVRILVRGSAGHIVQGLRGQWQRTGLAET